MGKLNLNIVKPEPMVLVNYRIRKATKEGMQEIAEREGFHEAEIARHYLEEGVKSYFEHDQTREVECE